MTIIPPPPIGVVLGLSLLKQLSILPRSHLTLIGTFKVMQDALEYNAKERQAQSLSKSLKVEIDPPN